MELKERIHVKYLNCTCALQAEILLVCVEGSGFFFYDPIIPLHLASGASEVLTMCLLNEEMNRMSSDVSRPEGG